MMTAVESVTGDRIRRFIACMCGDQHKIECWYDDVPVIMCPFAPSERTLIDARYCLMDEGGGAYRVFPDYDGRLWVCRG